MLNSRVIFVFLFLLNACSTQDVVLFGDDSEESVQTVFDSESEDKKIENFRVGQVKVPEEAEERKAESEKETAKKPKEKEVHVKPVKETPAKDAIEKVKQTSKKDDESSGKEQVPEKDETKQKDEEKEEKEEKEEDEIYPEEYEAYDKRSEKLWDKSDPLYFPGEEMVFAIKYLGITAAHIRLSSGKISEVANKKAFHYKAQLKSARFYRSIYKMEDSLETYVDVKTQLPIRYSLVQRETGQDVDDLQIFNMDEKKTYFFYKRDKDDKIKEEEKEAYIPSYFQDTFSAIFFVRGLPLNIGEVYEFPIMTRAKLWLVKMKIEKKEEVKIMGEWQDAYRLEAETRFPSELSKEKGKITFWVGAGPRKRLLRFSAKVRFGSIYGDLEEYKPGQKAVDLKGL